MKPGKDTPSFLLPLRLVSGQLFDLGYKNAKGLQGFAELIVAWQGVHVGRQGLQAVLAQAQCAVGAERAGALYDIALSTKHLHSLPCGAAARTGTD